MSEGEDGGISVSEHHHESTSLKWHVLNSHILEHLVAEVVDGVSFVLACLAAP